ncbi:Restriction endonuclease S subunit [Succiniclasticum ruminis]|uniref:Restriction endonuclease S subunit n=1 Tax=Succiniclasticum ruminis TaxID=40841 RepID=A0A1G6JDJ2_9FIRM|nr:restriction endonuclease subunit S [Succiniclasticum ruminis]SDC16485.1 Restriction endonuclease S subunit [Succiniclasticum ruminis]
MLKNNIIEMKPLNTYLTEYKEYNTAGTYKPVAIGKFGIRTRESIYKKELANDYSKNKIIFKNTLTVGMGSSQIDIGILTEDVLYSVSPAYHTYKISGAINSDYLGYCLKQKNYEMFNLYMKRGSRQGKSIDLVRWLTYCIPVYSIENQLYIVQILSGIEAIINKKLQILEKLDVLIKARFVEMFGNPEVICKDWIEKPLGELCEKVIRYPTFYGMEYLESGTRVIRIGNILEDGHMDVEDNNYVFVYNGVNNDFPETVIEINDIIMAVRGDGSAAKRIGIIRENKLVGANISPNLIRIKANHNIDPIYLFSFLTGEVGQKRLGAYVNKTAKKNIAAKDIVKVFVPTPPIEKQREYASFVAQVDKSKFSKIA